MEMLVLRRKASGAHPPVGTGREFEARFEDLPPSEIRGLRRDENILAASRPMPLKLIEPVSSGPPAPASLSEENVAWGLKAVGASTSRLTGKGVTVAVLDTGIDAKHPAFPASELNIVGRNFTGGNPQDITDTHPEGHGTHCAGILFGRPVNNTRIGVAPGITNAVVGKVLGPNGGSTGTLVTAINWAIENKAHIISMSLGIDLVGFREELVGEGVHSRQATSMANRVLIDNVRFFDKFGNLLRSGAAFGRSVLIVAATGNESDRSGDRYKEGAFVVGASYPAATEDFVSVAAVEATGDDARPYRVAGFSNADGMFAGPGVGIVSAVPGAGLGSLSGTSMATPHVSGVAALWAEKLMRDGPFSAGKVVFEMRRTAVRPPDLDEADVGFGISQAPQS